MRYSKSHVSIWITLFLTTIVAIGCNTGLFYEKRLAGKYGLVAVDVEEQMAIGVINFSTGGEILIPETVYAVGWNDDFIIAKQHPAGASVEPNKGKTNYYILRVSDGKVWGPLPREEFSRERSRQNVPNDLEFSLVFENLK